MSSTAGERDVVETLVGFARAVRAAGVPAGPQRVHAMLDAVDQLGARQSESVYWAGRLTLCASPEDIVRYDRVFAAYFAGRLPRIRAQRSRPAPLRLSATPAGADAQVGLASDGPPPERLATASTAEVLRHRDVTELTAAERAEIELLVSALTPAGPERISRRRRPSRHGPLDPRRTVRATLRQGGEVAQLRRHLRTRRPRRIVLLVDVSGSMAPYAPILLRFAHATCRARPGTEVFTVGTRLTRVTRELRQRDPVAALNAVSAAVPDWSGGTRLGEELKEFLDTWGQRGLARGAMVVIASDGWERGDPALLGAQAARLARLAWRVIWVNPHRGRSGYAPVTGGMRAALPHVDRLVAGHSLGAMEELAAMVSEDGRHA
jgi:hypothetical protein